MRIAKIGILALMTMLLVGITYAGGNLETTNCTGLSIKANVGGDAVTYISNHTAGVGINFNVSVKNPGQLCNISNVTVCFISSNANTTGLEETGCVGATTNASSVNYEMNTSVSMYLLEDATDYTLKAKVVIHNNTEVNQTNVTNSTAITIDTGVPGIPSSLSPTDGTVDQDGKVSFSATVVGENVTQCTLLFSSDGGAPIPSVSTTMTHLGNLCEKNDVAMPMSRAGYSWGIRASDGTNTTDSSYIELKVESGGTTAKKAYLLQQQEAAGENGLVWIVLIVAVLYLFSRGKGKKK